MRSASSSGEVGSKVSPASPTASPSAVVELATTGVPQAIASSAGRPKPSYSEGNASSSAAL